MISILALCYTVVLASTKLTVVNAANDRSLLRRNRRVPKLVDLSYTRDRCSFLAGNGDSTLYDYNWDETQKQEWNTGYIAAGLVNNLFDYLEMKDGYLKLDQGVDSPEIQILEILSSIGLKNEGPNESVIGNKLNETMAVVSGRIELFTSSNELLIALENVKETLPLKVALARILKERVLKVDDGDNDDGNDTNIVIGNIVIGRTTDKDQRGALSKDETMLLQYPWLQSSSWSVDSGGFGKTFIEDEIQNDLKVCIHEKYGSPENLSLSEYSEILASFDKFEKVKSKAEQQMEQKPLSRIENEAEVVGNVTNVETFSWKYMKEEGNGIDDVRFDLEDEEKLTKVLDVLCDVTVLSEELPDIAKTARKLEWTKDGLIELKVNIRKFDRGDDRPPLNVLRMNVIGEFSRIIEDLDSNDGLPKMIADVYSEYGFSSTTIIDSDKNTDNIGNLVFIYVEVRGTEVVL